MSEYIVTSIIRGMPVFNQSTKDHKYLLIMYTHSNISIKQVYHNIKKCCISLYRPGNQYIFVHLQIKYLSIAGLNLDEN